MLLDQYEVPGLHHNPGGWPNDVRAGHPSHLDSIPRTLLESLPYISMGLSAPLDEGVYSTAMFVGQGSLCVCRRCLTKVSGPSQSLRGKRRLTLPRNGFSCCLRLEAPVSTSDHSASSPADSVCAAKRGSLAPAVRLGSTESFSAYCSVVPTWDMPMHAWASLGSLEMSKASWFKMSRVLMDSCTSSRPWVM